MNLKRRLCHVHDTSRAPNRIAGWPTALDQERPLGSQCLRLEATVLPILLGMNACLRGGFAES